MITKTQLTTFLFMAALIWGFLLLVDGVAVQLNWLAPLSKVAGILVILLGLFDRYFWRFSIFRPWLVNRPLISGTWKAEFRSDWIDPTTNQLAPTALGYFAVKQTYSQIHVRLMTQESSSMALTASVIQLPDQSFQLAAVYRNESRISVRHRSPIHNGSLLLNIADHSPVRLDGHYWTDRSTRGELLLTDHNSRVVNDFELAKALF